MKAFNESVEAVKKEVSILNNALKGKKWLVGDSVTMADIACGTVLTIAYQLFLEAGFRKGKADATKWFENFIALPEVVSSCGNIKCCNKALKPGVAGAATPAKAQAPAKAKKGDEIDEDDLFGDDDDDGEAAKAAAKKAAE